MQQLCLNSLFFQRSICAAMSGITTFDEVSPHFIDTRQLTVPSHICSSTPTGHNYPHRRVGANRAAAWGPSPRGGAAHGAARAVDPDRRPGACPPPFPPPSDQRCCGAPDGTACGRKWRRGRRRRRRWPQWRRTWRRCEPQHRTGSRSPHGSRRRQIR